MLQSPRAQVALVALSVLLLRASVAGALEADGPPPAPIPSVNEHTGASTVDRHPLRLGALVGVGFPRPLAIEAMAKLGGLVGIGADYGVLPTTSLDGVSTSLWSLAGDVRVFPFRNVFFVGLRGGFEHIGASYTTSIASLGSLGSFSESAAIDAWCVNPRLGFLWTTASGFSIGMDAGVQVSASATVSSSLPPASSSYLASSTPVRDLTGVLPTVDLLRIGFLF